MVKMADVPYFIARNGKTGDSFKSLVNQAKKELQKLRGRAEIVCGPITTGGWGDTVTNLLVFNHAIEVLEKAGRPMWSQVPYEAGLAELEDQWRRQTGELGYCHPILTEFYEPLFDAEPKLIHRAWFISGKRGWKTSFGSKWEHKKMLKRGIHVDYFQHEWHCNVPDLSTKIYKTAKGVVITNLP